MISVALLTINELVRRRFILAALCATAVLVGLTDWGFTHLMHMHDRHGRPLTEIEVRSMTAVLVVLITYMFSFVLAAVAVFSRRLLWPMTSRTASCCRLSPGPSRAPQS